MRFKLFVCVAVLALAATACKKGSAAAAAASTTAAAKPAGSSQAGTPGQPSAATPPKPVPAQLPDVLARVNGEDVKKADLERMIKTMEGRAGQAVPPDRRDEIYRSALDQLVVYTLLKQEAKTRNITIDDNEIDAKMKELKGQFPTQEAFDKALKDRNMTADSLKSNARADLSVNKVMESAVSNIPGPTDAEAKDFYEKNPDKFKQEEQVRASHILVRVQPNADEKAKARAKAEIDSVLKQLKAGGDFAKLAQQHSQDSSAAQGGDLGYFPRGQMVLEFDKAAFALPVGQLSGIVTTQFGYHVLKVTDKKPARTVPFDEAQAQIKQFLEQQKKQQAADGFIEGLKKKAKIEILI
ncbi:MAG TPA: peptidylprolyl isomerase [Vicinamibacterales bacterium]